MATTKKSTQDEKDTKKKTTTAKKETAKSATKAATTKKAASTKTTSKKETTKKTATKASTKVAATKKTTSVKGAKKTSAVKEPEEKKKVTQKKVTTEGFSVKGSNEIDDLLSVLSVTDHSEPTPAPKKTTKATAKTADKKTKETAKTTSAKKAKPSEIKRPERKAKTFTKEEKVLYKRLEEAFTYIANLTMVMEERLLDKKVITDLTLGEIHVLEVVDKESTMPMTKIANELKITVGSLTTCVNRLVKKEYLIRERDQEDHRIMKISTTLKAKKVLKIHDRFHEDILYGILDGVTIRDATKVMTQVARTLENYYNPKEKNYEKPIDKKKKKNI